MIAQKGLIKTVADMKQCLSTVRNTDLHSSTERKEKKGTKLPNEYAVWRVLFLKVQARIHSSEHLLLVQLRCSNFGSELIVVVQLHDQLRVAAAE
ncbi:Uncharacterized protein BM_BM14270 [Brugia malayi]|uniref:Bm14270 n=1 Tax=Brugia malayi TaxID=6279 RepID=A0A0J9Y1V2_BRUMA|nr:Uncharacterized protein BM_BM14270 [Brugia malayi]CDP99884.1 Bm14270 [Brugia malayi]VIO91683.1 Uncharacterized protein BM_BM14270 [Brugia malayi]